MKATIVLLGSGNVASHLGKRLVEVGHHIVQVYSRNMEHAQALASMLGSSPVNSLDEINKFADYYILAISDQAIPKLASQLQGIISTGTLIHTSGSTDIETLREEGGSNAVGVLYPLQTFSKQKPIHFSEVPLAIEAKPEKTLKNLKIFADSISDKTFFASSQQRMALHVAAVFACNFTNYFYSIAENILEEQGLNYDLIKPLIEETAQKAQQFSPKTVQTGPAIRRDSIILTKHINFLQQNPIYSNLYSDISRQIMKNDPEKES